MENCGDGYLEREKEAVNGFFEGLLESKLVREDGTVHASDLVWNVIVYSYCKKLKEYIIEMKPEFGMWLRRVFTMPNDPPYSEKELKQLSEANLESLREEFKKFYKHRNSLVLCRELPAIMAKFLNFRMRWMKGRAGYIKRVTCPDCHHRHDGTFHGICDCPSCSD